MYIVMFCREITDPQFHSQKLSAKSAKDLYDKFQKLEKDYQHQFSGNLPNLSGNIYHCCSFGSLCIKFWIDEHFTYYICLVKLPRNMKKKWNKMKTLYIYSYLDMQYIKVSQC